MNLKPTDVIRAMTVWTFCIAAPLSCGGRESPPNVLITEDFCASLFPVRQGGICLLLSDDPSPMIETLGLMQTQTLRDNGRYLLWIPGVDCNAVDAIAAQVASFRPLGRPICFLAH